MIHEFLLNGKEPTDPSILTEWSFFVQLCRLRLAPQRAFHKCRMLDVFPVCLALKTVDGVLTNLSSATHTFHKESGRHSQSFVLVCH